VNRKKPQELFNNEIADTITEYLNSDGIAEHLRFGGECDAATVTGQDPVDIRIVINQDFWPGEFAAYGDYVEAGGDEVSDAFVSEWVSANAAVIKEVIGNSTNSSKIDFSSIGDTTFRHIDVEVCESERSKTFRNDFFKKYNHWPVYPTAKQIETIDSDDTGYVSSDYPMDHNGTWGC